jgi:hypothetical protein
VGRISGQVLVVALLHIVGTIYALYFVESKVLRSRIIFMRGVDAASAHFLLPIILATCIKEVYSTVQYSLGLFFLLIFT